MTVVQAPKRNRRSLTTLAGAMALAATSIGLWAGAGSTAQAAALPTPDHVVVVVLENHAYCRSSASSSAPYINSLKSGGANLTQSYGLTHPSQPNYFTLFSGSNQGRHRRQLLHPRFLSAPNLASELIAAGKTWASYNETPPSQGSTTCTSGKLRPQAQPLVRLLQRADQHREDLDAVPDRLHHAAQGLLRRPEPVQ